MDRGGRGGWVAGGRDGRGFRRSSSPSPRASQKFPDDVRQWRRWFGVTDERHDVACRNSPLAISYHAARVGDRGELARFFEAMLEVRPLLIPSDDARSQLELFHPLDLAPITDDCGGDHRIPPSLHRPA